MIRSILYIFLLVIWTATAHAGTETPAQIEYLLNSVGQSACVFFRNGSEYAANDAEKHLRKKYRWAKRSIKSADDFIARVATKSSVSGKSYFVLCPGQSRLATAQWLTQKLREHSGEQRIPLNTISSITDGKE